MIFYKLMGGNLIFSNIYICCFIEQIYNLSFFYLKLLYNRLNDGY